MMLPEVADALKKGLPVTVFGAVMTSKLVGVLAGAASGDSYEIHSLYVLPYYRRRGVGRALVEKLEQVLEKDDLIIKAEFTMQNRDNETLPPFLGTMEFEEEAVTFPRYYIGNLGDLKIDQRLMKMANARSVAFSYVPEHILRTASNISIQEGYPLPDGGLLSKNVDKEISQCVISGEDVKAYVAVELMGGKGLKIAALWSSLSDPREMVAMLSAMINEMKKKHPPDTKVAMLVLTPIVVKIIDHLFDKVELCSYSFVRL